MTERAAKLNGYENLSPGQIIRGLRLERGWSQRELATRVERIDAAGVSKIETGDTKLGRARAKRFARALDVPVSLLLPPVGAQPTLREVLDHLRELRTDVALLAGNQERLLALAEHQADHEQQSGERESTSVRRPRKR